MAERVNHPLVTKYDEVRQNVQTFNEVLKGLESLQANLLRFKSWYYLPELDAVAPSKFIGFADMTGDYYQANRKGGLNGGLTDPRLSRWFQEVEEGSNEYQHVFDKVQQLLADNGKAFKKKPHLRFNAPPGWKAPVGNLGITNRNLYIGGEWVDSTADSSYEVRNPAHRYHVLAEVQAAGVEDAERAVAAATDAASSWAATPAPQRADILYRVHELMRDRREEFARLITLEEGKSLPDARAEVQRSLNIIQYAAGEGRRMFGYTTPSETRDTVAYTLRRPLGVVAVITPWNFPLAIPAWKIAPALICGNAVVFKPASSTPLSAIKLTETFIEAGLPPGVLNLVTGPGGSVGSYLVNHPDIAGISFTGSTEIGTGLYAQAASTLKKVQCEMGGKNAVIVLADADMEQAVGSVAIAAFGSTGQRCTATSRVIVEESAMDTFLEGLVERTKGLTVGDGLDSHDVGPVVSEGQFQKIMEYIEHWQRGGGKPASRRRGVDEPGIRRGTVHRANHLHRRRPGDAHRQRGDLRAGAHGILVSGPGPRHRYFQQRAVRPLVVHIHQRPAQGFPVHRGRGSGDGPRQRPDVGGRGASALRRLQGLRGRAPRTGYGGGEFLQRGGDGVRGL